LVSLIQPFLIPAVAKMVASYLNIDQLCSSEVHADYNYVGMRTDIVIFVETDSAISETGELLLSVWSGRQQHEFGFVDPFW
jgi:hypothetical protein